MDLMYEAIIATDLAVYFQVRPKLESAMTGQFNMQQAEHRSAHSDGFMALTSVRCAVCAYDDQVKRQKGCNYILCCKYVPPYRVLLHLRSPYNPILPVY